jgi:protein-S-isoprenylcysteine O-methyltransferase Ste14
MNLSTALDILALFMGSGYSTIPVFWFMMHPFVERWRRHGRGAYWVVLPLWTMCIAIVFAVALRYRTMYLYTNWIAWAPGGLLLLAGSAIFRSASTNFSLVRISGLAELEPDRHRQELVVTGIRSRVRHPIYLGHLCEMLGWCVGSGLTALYVLTVLAVVTGAMMIRMEDRELEARFGQAYREYCERVPAIIPRIR